MIAGLYEGRGVFELIAAAASAVAVWAQARVAPDPVEDLTYRLRHPVRHALRHPIQFVERKINTALMGD